MPSNKNRRPSLISSLAWYLPVLALVVIAIYMVHPLVLIPLLVAVSLAMATICHAIGFAPEATFGRTVARRGAAWLVLFTAYTALVWLLVALPLVSLTTAPSLVGAVMLALALAAALAFLWRAWPAFGLVFLWDDAFPEPGKGSWIFTAVARSLSFARHLAAEERFFSHFLPSAFCTLLLAIGALVLSGLYDVIPSELRTASLWLYGVVVVPVCCLVIANRAVRALLCERGSMTARRRQTPKRATRKAQAQAQPQPQPQPQPAGDELPTLTAKESAPGARDQTLLSAARAGDIPRALAALEAGADPDTVPEPDDDDQRSVLTLAALHPDMRLLRALIGQGADINLTHANTSTLLAVTRDGCMSRAEAVMVLLANGADVTARDPEGNMALHHAARSTDLSVAAGLIDAGAPRDALNRQGRTPLAIACRATNWTMAEWLIKHGAQAEPEGGEPALVAAVSIAEDDATGAQLLLRHKARVNAHDARGRHALMHAALEDHGDIVQYLLDARADPNLSDPHGTTALMEAAHNGETETVRALLDAGADPAPRDRHGRDALTLTCLSARSTAATVRVLIEAGADPKSCDPEGRSALACASDAARWDLVAVLDPTMELPASVAGSQAPDPEAASPAHLLDALRFGHWGVAGRFTTAVNDWPRAALADMYLTLANGDHPRACTWLLDHGLPAQTALEDGRPLLDALIDSLPASADALLALIAAGASPAGAGTLARAMRALVATPQSGVALAMALWNQGADPFAPLDDGRSVAHLATAPGWQPVLERLLDTGINPNARDHAGRTPLHAALEHADCAVATVRALIAAGADPELSHANGETPLGLAMERPELLNWLHWSTWPLPHRRLRADDLPQAAAAGDSDAVAKLLALGFPVDASDTHGASALVYACGRGHRDTAMRLLEAGADPAFATSAGVTALVAAINMGQSDLIALLIERGAQVDQHLPGDITALMVASGEGHADAIKALIVAGADPQARDARQRSALHAAAMYSFESRDSLRCRRVLDALLEHDMDVNAMDSRGLTPLLLLLGAHAQPGAACDPTHLGALLPVLLDAGARIDHADPRGITSLHACAMHALLAPARILITRGANRAAVDARGRRPADVARELGYTDVAVELDERARAIPGVHQTLRTPAGPAG
jgi:ankyrin repeat protein